MKATRLILSCIICALTANAEDISIIAIGQGQLTWDDPHGSGIYAVEWSADLSVGNWQRDWSSLRQIIPTGGSVTTAIPMFFRVVHYPTIDGEMILIPGDDQPLGPLHDYYMARYPVTVAEYMAFLNDAEMNTDNAKGANMHFVSNGDVRTSPSGTFLFAVSNSHLIYDKDAPVGSRYTIFPPDRGNHPITGVSWYGAVKYCNWLTLHHGYGESQRAYIEGSQAQQWRPANLTYDEWQSGFTIAQRQTWINSYAGYRLPLVFGTGPNYFNEYYKAAAWTGTNNATYGFGRNTIVPADANYRNSGHPFEIYEISTTPVGFYNGQTYMGFETHTNSNHYGIYDLCGNVSEWGTGNGYSAFSFPWNGGSWKNSLGTCNGVQYQAAIWESACKSSSGSTTADSMGFRLVRSAIQP